MKVLLSLMHKSITFWTPRTFYFFLTFLFNSSPHQPLSLFLAILQSVYKTNNWAPPTFRSCRPCVPAASWRWKRPPRDSWRGCWCRTSAQGEPPGRTLSPPATDPCNHHCSDSHIHDPILPTDPCDHHCSDSPIHDPTLPTNPCDHHCSDSPIHDPTLPTDPCDHYCSNSPIHDPTLPTNPCNNYCSNSPIHDPTLPNLLQRPLHWEAWTPVASGKHFTRKSLTHYG